MGDGDRTDNISLANSDNSKIVSVITDGIIERLAVDASITVNPASPNTGKFISVFLRNGGSRGMDVDGSVTPVVFSAGPPTGKRWYIHRMIITMRDGGITWAKFGGISTLSNGVDIDYDTGGVNQDLLDTNPIIRNLDFVQYGYDAQINTATQDVLFFRWSFSKSGTVLDLNNTDGDNFNITVNDDLTAISRFRTIIQGFEVDE